MNTKPKNVFLLLSVGIISFAITHLLPKECYSTLLTVGSLLLWGVVFLMVIKRGIEILSNFAFTITSDLEHAEINKITNKGIYDMTLLSIRFIVAMALIISMAEMSFLT
ncbi:hypothetical protein [Pseudomonas haemolytica]|jgi:hypothetical protein|uniref:Uncharacterized protein n=1 Tax=Pseudomonas haemolytica TaxID=2600065 RepID=A0ABS1H093_9PSED|nr:hypothetical protein [Pseudomonas haemolytica]MBK3462626.1 hypothetical protein [Pseudomonas haemolytica]